MARTRRSYPYNGEPCTVDGCDKPAYSREMCVMHVTRLRRTGDVGSAHSRRQKTSLRDSTGNKRCKGCALWLPESDYTKSSKSSDGLLRYCRTCNVDRQIRGKYGIGTLEVQERLAAQGGVCAVCGADDPSGRNWAIDHDHACCSGKTTCGSCVRGILCNRCNVMLGMARDNVDTLHGAITYLSERISIVRGV